MNDLVDMGTVKQGQTAGDAFASSMSSALSMGKAARAGKDKPADPNAVNTATANATANASPDALSDLQSEWAKMTEKGEV